MRDLYNWLFRWFMTIVFGILIYAVASEVLKEVLIGTKLNQILQIETRDGFKIDSIQKLETGQVITDITSNYKKVYNVSGDTIPLINGEYFTWATKDETEHEYAQIQYLLKFSNPEKQPLKSEVKRLYDDLTLFEFVSYANDAEKFYNRIFTITSIPEGRGILIRVLRTHQFNPSNTKRSFLSELFGPKRDNKIFDIMLDVVGTEAKVRFAYMYHWEK